MVNDLDPGPAKETVAAIEGLGGQGLAVPGSVTERGFTDDLVAAAIDEFGVVDIAINNAGYSWDTVIQKTDDEQWEAMLDILVTAPFRMLRSLAPVFREAAKNEAAAGLRVTRKVVNVSSVAGTGGNVGQSGYSAGNAGVIGLTKTLAKEWGPSLHFAVAETLRRAQIDPEEVDTVLLGQAVQAHADPNPARIAAHKAGVSMFVPAMTMNKLCLSGLATFSLADSLIAAGTASSWLEAWSR